MPCTDYMYILRLVRQSAAVSHPTTSLISFLQRLVPEEGNSRHGGLSVVGVSGRVYTATIDTGEF